MNNSITAESGETVATFPLSLYLFLFLGTVIAAVTLTYIYFKITLNKVLKGKLLKVDTFYIVELKVRQDFFFMINQVS